VNIVATDPAGASTDGPMPFVAGGLLLIIGALSVILVGRRITMERDERDAQSPALSPGFPPTPVQEPSRSFG